MVTSVLPEERAGDGGRQQRTQRHSQQRHAQHAAGGPRVAVRHTQAAAAEALSRHKEYAGVDKVELDGSHLWEGGDAGARRRGGRAGGRHCAVPREEQLPPTSLPAVHSPRTPPV